VNSVVFETFGSEIFFSAGFVGSVAVFVPVVVFAGSVAGIP